MFFKLSFFYSMALLKSSSDSRTIGWLLEWKEDGGPHDSGSNAMSRSSSGADASEVSAVVVEMVSEPRSEMILTNELCVESIRDFKEVVCS